MIIYACKKIISHHARKLQSFQSRVHYKVYPRFQERMMEIEDTNIMPHAVLKADHMLPACETGTILSSKFQV